jgi:ribose transport system permease protein
MRRRHFSLGLDRFSGIYLGVVFIIGFSLLTNQFFNITTAHVIASTQATAGLIAIALLIPMVCNQFDLSVGSNANLVGMIAVVLQVNLHWSVWPAIILSLAVGFLVGFINGFIVVVLKVSSFIATLGVSSVLTAVTVIVTKDLIPPAPASATWSNITQVQVGGFELIIIYLLAMALLVWWMLEFTPVGRYLHAIGGNAEAARLSGVRVGAWSWLALVMAGGISGFAGLLYTSLTGPSFTFGPTLLLPGFAAVFLGATQIRPGRFNVWGTMIAIFVLAIGVEGLQLLSSATWLSGMFNGVALVAAVSLAVTRTGGARRFRPRRSGRSGPDGREPAVIENNEVQSASRSIV